MTINPTGKATTKKETFSRETSVAISIDANRSIIWQLLTNADDMPRWNSTITALDGDILAGGKIHLKSILDDKRVFKLTVKKLAAEIEMVWGDKSGDRVFRLENGPNDSIIFSMHEKIGGWMFPLYARYIPDFDESFEQFAADLKREAESIQQTASE